MRDFVRRRLAHASAASGAAQRNALARTEREQQFADFAAEVVRRIRAGEAVRITAEVVAALKRQGVDLEDFARCRGLALRRTAESDAVACWEMQAATTT